MDALREAQIVKALRYKRVDRQTKSGSHPAVKLLAKRNGLQNLEELNRILALAGKGATQRFHEAATTDPAVMAAIKRLK